MSISKKSHALEVVGVSRTFDESGHLVAALRSVDLRLEPGTFTAVMGPSGSGKSTLLGCIAGTDSPTSGTVSIAGTLVNGLSESDRTVFRRTHVGLVFQSFHLLGYLTAAQNVALPLRLAGRAVDDALVSGLLDQVGLSGRDDQFPATMSGGQQQRVAIARALVAGPSLVLADEPTGALDSATARSVLALLRACVDESGQTLVMVTHDPVAAAHADAVVFLVDGQVAGRMAAPTVDAVAGQLAHLDELVAS